MKLDSTPLILLAFAASIAAVTVQDADDEDAYAIEPQLGQRYDKSKGVAPFKRLKLTWASIEEYRSYAVCAYRVVEGFSIRLELHDTREPKDTGKPPVSIQNYNGVLGQGFELLERDRLTYNDDRVAYPNDPRAGVTIDV